MQGDVLQPILFSFYVNDFESEFIANDNCAIQFQDITLFLLMYVDDTILMFESVGGLQNMLKIIYDYAIKWGFVRQYKEN